ncbi:TRAP transporter substrate-binding protein [Anaerotignum sp.]|uniref:TRAP transporter substrate-binding protein n=1 Tax=Anaerotignum sp. TaxID=2039241 RepID=UPI002715372C|nr:TRAP transporter substrate-binding protein [Anaerotignum sp.]
MKRFLSMVAMTTALVVALTACGGSSTQPAAEGAGDSASAEPVIIKLGTTVNEQDSFQIAAEKFKELVAEKTNGAYEIEIYPNGSLGDERTMLESMQMGTLDMGIITSGPFVNFIPEMGVLDMPFLFPDNASAYKVLDGEIGQGLLDEFEGANLKGLAYAERGFRNLTNNVKPVTSAADLNGLKIRVMENEVYISTFESLGVNAVPMAWSEALTALQQHTIDGQENPVNVIHSFKLWESQKYLTMTRHAYASAIITMSLQKFNALPEDVQVAFKEAAQEAAEYERQWVADNEASQLEDIKANGVEVVENPDIESFKAAVQPTYDKYGEQYADLIAQIQDALSK